MADNWTEALERALGEVRETYAARGVGQRIGFGEFPAVIVVDFQRSYTRTWRSRGPEPLYATARLLDAARAAAAPVFYTYVGYAPDAPDAGVWGEKAPTLIENRRGSEACEIDPLVAPKPGEEVLEKTAPSAFFGTHLHQRLTDRGVDTIVVAGTSTSGCVRATVVDGLSHGYRVIIPRECVTDPSVPSELVALSDMDVKYGDVVPLEEALVGIGSRSAAEPARQAGGHR